MVEPWVTPGLDEARPSFGIAAAVTGLVVGWGKQERKATVAALERHPRRTRPAE